MKKWILVASLILQGILFSACGNPEVVSSLLLPARADVVAVRSYDVAAARDAYSSITDAQEIDDLFDTFSSVSIMSRKSYNDTPMTDDYLKIVFEISEGLSSNVVYVFEEEGAYYVEQPYHGIFSIDEAKYSAICR